MMGIELVVMRVRRACLTPDREIGRVTGGTNRPRALLFYLRRRIQCADEGYLMSNKEPETQRESSFVVC